MKLSFVCFGFSGIPFSVCFEMAVLFLHVKTPPSTQSVVSITEPHDF